MRTLYKHCHIIVDDKREYLDGSIIINDKYIEEVFVNTKEINDNDLIQIDLQGNIITPSFFDSKSNDKEQIGVFKKYIYSDKILDVDTHLYSDDDIKDYNHVKAITQKNNYHKNNLIKTLFDVNNKSNIFVDGVSDISQIDSLDLKKDTMLSYVLMNNVFVEFGIDDSMSDNYIKFILKNIDVNNISLISYNHQELYKQVKRLIQLNISWCDIVGLSSLNALRFYKEDKLEGSIIRGKLANIICFNDAGDIKFCLKEGRKC